MLFYDWHGFQKLILLLIGEKKKKFCSIVDLFLVKTEYNIQSSRTLTHISTSNLCTHRTSAAYHLAVKFISKYPCAFVI